MSKSAGRRGLRSGRAPRRPTPDGGPTFVSKVGHGSLTQPEHFLIADTSGLVSLAVNTDSNHAAAVVGTEQLHGKQSTILVPYEVLVETVNVLGKRVGHAPVATVAAYLSTTPLFVVVDSSTEARAGAFARFKAQPQAVSLTDCIVMAVADEYRTKAIFGFDTDHARNGYAILRDESSQVA